MEFSDSLALGVYFQSDHTAASIRFHATVLPYAIDRPKKGIDGGGSAPQPLSFHEFYLFIFPQAWLWESHLQAWPRASSMSAP